LGTCRMPTTTTGKWPPETGSKCSSFFSSLANRF
jgi:hypothetical protein